MPTDVVLTVEGPHGSAGLERTALEALADAGAAEVAGRWAAGLAAVPFASLFERVPDDPRVTHATFHAADGYAASIPLRQAMEDGVVLVPPASAGRRGVRLVVSSGSTTCLNVKAVERVELTIGPGKHTVDPNPHTPARVSGWDADA